MMNKKVAVIAGTSVDTQMGAEYIAGRNEEAAGGAAFIPVCMPVTETCDEQIKFQYSDDDGKLAVIDRIFDEAIEAGIRDFFIYCNSLSGAFDFDTYEVRKSLNSGEEIRISTPLQAYRKLGGRFGRVGLMAANNLSAHAIEETMMANDPDIYVIGTGNMAVVSAIEEGLAPSEIVEKCGLRQMAEYMEACGAEALILGCTHFPYIKEELAKVTELPLIDPADAMFEKLMDNL